MKKIFALALAALMLAGMLAGCGTATTPQGGSSTTASATTAAAGTSAAATAAATEPAAPAEPKIFYDWGSTRATFSPHNYTSRKIIDVFSTLVGIVSTVDGSDQLTFVPHDTLELPTSSDGGTTWICKLRDDIQFSDGTPITAETYEYSAKMLIDPKLANKNAAYMFDPCVVLNAKEYFQGSCEWEAVGFKAKDATTLEITLKYPATEIDFFTNLGALIWPVHPELYEAGMNADRTSTNYGTDITTMAYSGPFTLKEWVLDGYEILVRNENNPLVKQGFYFLDEVNTRYVTENATRWQMFENNELDWTALSGDYYDANKNDPRGVKSISASVWGIFVNGESKNVIMQDNDFRLALYHSAPRVSIATEIYRMYDSPNYLISTGISVTGSDGVSKPYRDTPEAKALVAKYCDDDALALQLFEAAYARNGSKKITIEMTYFDGQEEMKRSGEVCQEKWEGLFGADRFELTLRAVQPQQAYDNYRVGDYDLGTGVRSGNSFNMWSSLFVYTSDYSDKYLTGFYNEEFDQLYFDSMYGDLLHDPDARIKALARMEALLMEHCVFIPTMQNNNTWLINERIELPTYTYLPWVTYGFFQSDIIPG